MKALIDNNVVMDVLMKREPHCERSTACLKLCGAGITGFITTNQTTDIFYLLCRLGTDEATAKGIIKTLTENLTLVDVLAKDVHAALDSAMNDYEDALAACCAKRVKADYIITRNTKDFEASPVPALTPADFMDKFYP
jgi:predicted nucleic acid-binding protein